MGRMANKYLMRFSQAFLALADLKKKMFETSFIKAGKAMKWTVDLKISYIPCPPEHAPAYWAALKELQELCNQRKKSEEKSKNDETTTG